MSEDDKMITFGIVVLLGIAALVVYWIAEGRRDAERRRYARVLETIELRLDKIEATMKALPQLLLEAYYQLEAKRNRRGDLD